MLVGDQEASFFRRAPREASGHHFVTVFVCHQVSPKNTKPGLKLFFCEYGGSRKLHFLLTYIPERLEPDLPDQFLFFRPGKSAPHYGFETAQSHTTLDDKPVDMIDHIVHLFFLSARPGANHRNDRVLPSEIVECSLDDSHTAAVS